MYARSTTIQGDPQRMDDGIAYVRDKVMPGVAQMDGCVGLSMLCDRMSGRCIVTTSWADADAMHRSAESVRSMRDRAAEMLGGTYEVNEWEIAILHRDHPAGDGSGAQVTWARVPPTRMKELLDAYRINLMPRLQHLPGFCSLSMLVDRRGGREVVVTSWESREALERVRKEARHLRDQFVQAVGAGIADSAEMELALAHLRVPETT